MKITLRSRIYLAILPLLLLFLGLTTYLVLNARSAQIETNEIALANIQLGRGFSDIGTTLTAYYTLLEIEHDETPDWLPPHLEKLRQQLDENITNNESALRNKRLLKLYSDTARYELGLRDIGLQTDKFLKKEADTKTLLQLVQNAQNETQTIRESWDAYIEDIQTEFNRKRKIVYDIVIGSMAFAIVLTLAISTLIWRRIINPIEQITQGMEEFTSESTPLDIDYKQKDELGELAETFSRMTHRLNQFQALSSKKLLKSSTALQTVLELSPDAFFILTDQWEPTYTSPKAAQLLENSSIQNGFPKAITEIFAASYSSQKPHFSKDFKEAIRLNVEDEERWFLIQAFPLGVQSTDLSDASITSDNQNLAVIFQDVTLLKLSDNLRQDLVATVSHELKTPITSARMCVYLLLEQSLGPLNPEQEELLKTARDDVNRQLSTIEHLLDLSRFEADKNSLQLSHFSVSALIEDSISAHNELAASYKIQLEVAPINPPLSIEADRQSLGIVLNNFLVNAIKYSGAGKLVTIEASATSTHARISVRDNGVGMDADTLKKAFDAYSRGDKQIDNVKGTGLGLKISKDIIEMHGGQIGCTSKLGDGSCFFMEIPLSQK